MFSYYLEEGRSLVGLANHLREQGVLTAHGQRHWNTSTLRGILTNPTSTGILYAGRKRARVPKNRRSPLQPVGRHGSSYHTPPEEWTVVGHIPAIVSQEQFDLIQAKLAQNQCFARRNNTSYPYLLRGLVSCGVCGCSCIGRSRPPLAYYTCRGKLPTTQSGLEEKCRSRFAPAQQLDTLVWQDVCEVLQNPAVIAQALERAQGGKWLPQEFQARRETLRKTLASLGAQMERLTEAYPAFVIPLEEYRKRRQELSERFAVLDNQAHLLERQGQQQMEMQSLNASITEFCQRVASGLEQATFEQKRHLIELLVDRVVVTMEEVEIRYVIPTSSRSEHLLFCHLHSDYFRREAVTFVIGSNGICFHKAILAYCSALSPS